MKLRNLFLFFSLICFGAIQAQDEIKDHVAKIQAIADEFPFVLDGLRNDFDKSKELIFQSQSQMEATLYVLFSGIAGLLHEMSSRPYTTEHQEKCRMLAQAWLECFTNSSSCGQSKADTNVENKLFSNLLYQVYGEKCAEHFSKLLAALPRSDNSSLNGERSAFFGSSTIKFHELLHRSFDVFGKSWDVFAYRPDVIWDKLTEQQVRTLLITVPYSVSFNTCRHCFFKGMTQRMKDSFENAIFLSFRLMAGMPLKEVTAQELKDYFSSTIMYPVSTDFMDKDDLEKCNFKASQDAEFAKQYEIAKDVNRLNVARQAKAIEAVSRFCK